jgi:hypothetical protein
MVRKKIYCTGLTRAAKAEKISCTYTTSTTNQPRKNPFQLYSFLPHSLQFQQSAGGHLSLVSLVTILQGPGDDPVHKAAFNHYSKECLVAAGGKDKEPLAVYSNNTVKFNPVV